jgi:hypothetical protein
MPEQTSPLRQRMIDDMSLRNMAALTQAAYIRAVKNFSKHFGKSPDKLTFEDVRQYQLSLVGRGLGPQAVNQIMCALRFFYKTTMGIKDAHEHIALARPTRVTVPQSEAYMVYVKLGVIGDAAGIFRLRNRGALSRVVLHRNCGEGVHHGP